MNLIIYGVYITNKGNIMKKLFLSALMLFSLPSLYATEANKLMNKYMENNRNVAYNNEKLNPEINDLINSDLIEQQNNRLNKALKSVYMAKTDKTYDMSWGCYLKSYFVDTQDNRVIREINQIERQLRNQLAILHHNTWEQLGWTAAKYATVILITTAVLKQGEIKDYVFGMQDALIQAATA